MAWAVISAGAYVTCPHCNEDYETTLPHWGQATCPRCWLDSGWLGFDPNTHVVKIASEPDRGLY